MSKHQEPRINRRTATRLLRGAPVTVPDALAGLLAAAAAPPRDGELAGEQAAAAAFLEATRRATVPHPRSRSMIRTTLAKLLTVKVAAAAAAVAVGGVATAAATGHLALSPGGSAPETATTSHAAASASVTVTSAPARDASSAPHQATPTPSLVGLCHAYTAGAGSDHGKALDNPAFTVLITTAGGRTKVDAYCTTLLAQHPSAAATTGSAARTSAPAVTPSHPTGAPSTHPTGAPTTHPTGAPTTRPTH